MAPLPKRKLSKARGRRRRSHNALLASTTGKCPFCQADKLSHRACPVCGKYGSKSAVKK